MNLYEVIQVTKLFEYVKKQISSHLDTYTNNTIERTTK